LIPSRGNAERRKAAGRGKRHEPRLQAGAFNIEPVPAKSLQQGFRHLAPGGIMAAYEQYPDTVHGRHYLLLTAAEGIS